MKFVLATRNPGKVREIRALFDNHDIVVLSLADFPDMPEVVEDGTTFTANAKKKAREVSAFTGLPALADDSGLVVDALDGAPGIYSSRFAPTTGERNRKVLDLLGDRPEEERTARFVCSLAFAEPDGGIWTVEETCEGRITAAASGAEGFGYDPIFYYPPLETTFAEIPLEAKNEVSHRGRALRAFKSWLLGGQDA